MNQEVYPYKEEAYRNTAIRFIKNKSGIFGMPDFALEADFFCRISDDKTLFYETEDEFVIYVNHFVLKDACLVTCHFPQDSRYEITHIVFEGRYLSFAKRNGEYEFNFEISGLLGPTRTLYAHSILRENGLTIRVEENDIGRCAGMYSKETYPALEIMAVHHYMFAMREIVKRLGLPEYLSRNSLGYLLILGFETCNQIHTDYPPHWHLIYRWPYFCGSQAPHIYVDEQGKMISNVMYVDGIAGVHRDFEPGEWCKFVDMYGKDMMAFKINDDGGMSVTKPGAGIYRMMPYEEEKGVEIYHGESYMGAVKVKVNLDAEEMEVTWKCGADAFRGEKICFDRLLGTVNSVTGMKQ